VFGSSLKNNGFSAPVRRSAAVGKYCILAARHARPDRVYSEHYRKKAMGVQATDLRERMCSRRGGQFGYRVREV